MSLKKHPFGQILNEAILGCFSKTLSVVVLLVHFPSLALADFSINEDFTNRDKLISTNQVLNMSVGRLQSPLKINGWDLNSGSAPPPQDRDIDIGDGTHGAFDNTTYDNFDEDGNSSNNIIVINTDNYTSGLNFTSFTLDTGKTLKPIGSLPLLIKVQGDVSISGIIDCEGENGEAISGSASTVASGGVGRCGGGNGGNGGSNSVAAKNGLPDTGSVTGGTAGSALAEGGGGGGGYNLSNSDAGPGEDPNDMGGSDGGAFGISDWIDPGFALLNGGAGGGGGSFISSDNGGAGGAGGGVIVIYAGGNITVSNTGEVLASGGNGGGGAFQSGAGGGGAGGSILMIAGGIFTNDRALGIRAIGGNGGSTSNVTFGGSDGGDGVIGRFWATDNDGLLSGSGSENPGVLLLGSFGTVNSVVGSYETILGVYDSNTLHPVLANSALTSNVPSGSSLNVFVATSAEETFAEDTYVNINELDGVKLERYLKVKIVTDSQTATDMVTLSSLTLNFVDGDQLEFEFISACGSTNTPNSPWFLLLLMLPLVVWFTLKRKLYWI